MGSLLVGALRADAAPMPDLKAVLAGFLAMNAAVTHVAAVEALDLRRVNRCYSWRWGGTILVFLDRLEKKLTRARPVPGLSAEAARQRAASAEVSDTITVVAAFRVADLAHAGAVLTHRTAVAR